MLIYWPLNCAYQACFCLVISKLANLEIGSSLIEPIPGEAVSPGFAGVVSRRDGAPSMVEVSAARRQWRGSLLKNPTYSEDYGFFVQQSVMVQIAEGRWRKARCRRVLVPVVSRGKGETARSPSWAQA